jgi:hypothetical protein
MVLMDVKVNAIGIGMTGWRELVVIWQLYSKISISKINPLGKIRNCISKT